MKTKLFLRNNVSRLQVVVLAGVLLTACGQKGALYLPKNPPPQTAPSQSATPNDAPKATPNSTPNATETPSTPDNATPNGVAPDNATPDNTDTQ